MDSLVIHDECAGCVTFSAETCEHGGFWRTDRGVTFCGPMKAYREKVRIQRLFKDAGMPKRFLSRTFENYEVGPVSRAAFDCSREYAENAPLTLRGVALYGPPGTGKTHLAGAILHRLIDRGVQGLFISVPDLLARLKATFDDRNGPRAEEIIKAAINVPVLILDDLGAENISGWAQEQIFRIINGRYENSQSVVCTSNYSPDALSRMFSIRMVSRLIEMAAWVPLEGLDRRLASGD